jgi:phosphate starvation-inducible PhoH-like protein
MRAIKAQTAKHAAKSVGPRRTYVAKSNNQATYIKMLEEQDPSVVVAHGPAGTGKTKLAVEVGLWKLLQRDVDKLVLTRPAVPVDDEQHGFIPGSLNDKMRPWLMPVMDAVEDAGLTLSSLILEGRIEIAPLAFMRGRTFKRSWIIVDEAQNCTSGQMLMLLTRIGEGSKIVVNGDVTQHDRDSNGLSDLIRRIDSQVDDQAIPQIPLKKKSVHIDQIALCATDVQRSAVVADVLRLYT